MELEEMNIKFNRYLQNETDNKKVFARFKNFYKYVNSNLNLKGYKTQRWIILCRVVEWLQRNKLQTKQFSTNWNGRMISKCMELRDEIKETQKVDTDKISDMLGEILQIEDFATMVCCLQILQSTKPKCISLALNAELSKESECLTDALAKNKDSLKNRKFYHTELKEMLSYNDCIEMHINPMYLIYPEGHELQHLFVNFETLSTPSNQTDVALDAIFKTVRAKETLV